jgi:hypothetical protein
MGPACPLGWEEPSGDRWPPNAAAAHTGPVPAPLASNFLAPNAAFVVLVLLMLVVFALLVVWPLVETLVRQQWGYTLGVLVLGPIGGLLWFTVGRRGTAPRGDALDHARTEPAAR